MEKHSNLPPSSAKRWINCPGSVRYGSRPSGFAAAEGTVAHAINEEFVSGRSDLLSLMEKVGTKVIQDGHEVIITEEMVDGAVAYRDLGEAILEEFKKDHRPASVEDYLEKRVYATSIDNRVWGTADRVIFRRGHLLYVIDYKFGYGVVEAEDNEQGLVYVTGVMDTLSGYAFDKVVFVIHQPRARHAEGVVRRFEITKAALDEFKARAKIAAEETKKPDARMAAGEWCAWCAIESTCPKRHEIVQKQAGVVFADSPPVTALTMVERLPEVRLMPNEALVRAFAWEDSVNSFFEAVKETLRERLTQGPVSGVKMVAGRTNRQWKDEKVAEAELSKVVAKERLYKKPEFVSPAQAEKLLGKKQADLIVPLVFRPEGKKSVALDTDPRPATSSSAADAFGGDNSLPTTIWPQNVNVTEML